DLVEVRDLVAGGAREEDRAEQHAADQAQQPSTNPRHDPPPYARSNNITSDGTSARTVSLSSLLTAAPSPAASGSPFSATPPRSSQIWYRWTGSVGDGLNSLCITPVPAVMRCISPGFRTAPPPRLSRCCSAPSRTQVTISMSR